MISLVKNIFSEKQSSSSDRMRLEKLQIGSVIHFGFMPQAALSGKKLHVVGQNTYVFDGDRMLCHVLAADKEHRYNLIVAESRGEHYLAISRRINEEEKDKLFDAKDLLAVEQKNKNVLRCKEGVVGFRGWVAPSYYNALNNVSGRTIRGDFRSKALPAAEISKEFTYTLLVNENNEHAVEIERYLDGRVDIYTTVFRRISDITQIVPPSQAGEVSANKRVIPQAVVEFSAQRKKESILKEELLLTQEVVGSGEVRKIEEKRPDPVVVELKPQPKIENVFKPVEVVVTVPDGAVTGTLTAEEEIDIPETASTTTQISAPHPEEKELLECSVNVARRVMDEAFRNKITLTELIRRVIDLPVSLHETVHITFSLSDEEYTTLARRYGMNPADKTTIRQRIIDDLAAFAGEA